MDQSVIDSAIDEVHGGIYYVGFVTNLMGATATTEFWRPDNMWQNFNQNKSDAFLWLMVYIS